MEPLISIITPVFNGEKFLDNAISSIKKQTYSHWELLVVNDGSDDKTEDIIKGFKDFKIRYYKQKNKGVSAARNLGLQNMNGDFFCFLDADDVLPEKSLECRLNVFKINNEISFVDGSVHIKNHNFSDTIKKWTPNFSGEPLEELLKLSGKNFLGNTWMIKRKPRVTYHFKEGLTHGEDLLFYIDLARQGGLYSYTEEPVLYYRKGHKSAMKNLKGLEQGYRDIYHEILSMDDIPYHLKQAYQKKAKSIIAKSYLGKRQPINALKAYLNNWNNH